MKIKSEKLDAVLSELTSMHKAKNWGSVSVCIGKIDGLDIVIEVKAQHPIEPVELLSKWDCMLQVNEDA